MNQDADTNPTKFCNTVPTIDETCRKPSAIYEDLRTAVSKQL